MSMWICSSPRTTSESIINLSSEATARRGSAQGCPRSCGRSSSSACCSTGCGTRHATCPASKTFGANGSMPIGCGGGVLAQEGRDSGAGQDLEIRRLRANGVYARLCPFEASSRVRDLGRERPYRPRNASVRSRGPGQDVDLQGGADISVPPSHGSSVAPGGRGSKAPSAKLRNKRAAASIGP